MNDNKVELICSNCKNAFVRYRRHLKNSKSGLYFCDKTCKIACQKIGGIIAPKHYGTAEENKKNQVNEPRLIKVKQFKNCFCGNQINSNKNHCNPTCRASENWDNKKKYFENHNDWQGIAEGSHKDKFYKRYLLEKRGHQCEICKIDKWMSQKIPLILDHISGNSSDNKLTNLRLVCGNCDMQLPTYKSKNKGHGRLYNKLYMQKQKNLCLGK